MNASGLTALFGALNASQVSLTVLPNGNGTVSVSPGKNVYTNGESVTLTAWPGANQRFMNWSGDASGNLNPLPLPLTASQVITANFVPGAATNPPVVTQPPWSRTLGAVTSASASVALFGLEFAASGSGQLPLLIVDGTSGTSYRLEHSWNLSPTNWSLLAPVTLNGSRLYFVDSPDTNYFQRFYRAVPQ